MGDYSLQAPVLTVPGDQEFFPAWEWCEKLAFAKYPPDEPPISYGTPLAALRSLVEQAVRDKVIKLRHEVTGTSKESWDIELAGSVVNFADLVKVGQEIGVTVERQPEGHWRELANKPELYLEDFRILTGALPGKWGLFQVSSKGVRFASSLDEDEAENMPYAMPPSDIAILRDWHKNVGKLVFPCTSFELVDWCERTGWEIGLPDGFVDAVNALRSGFGLPADTEERLCCINPA